MHCCCGCCQLEEASKLEHAELEELCKERTSLNSKIETLTTGICFCVWHLTAENSLEP